MNLLGWIPDKYLWLVKCGAVALVLVIGLIWWESNNAAQRQIGYDRAAGEYAAKLTKEKEVALVTERGWRKKLEDANNDRIETEKRLAQSRAAVAAADDRLRRSADNFRQRLSAASAETCRAAAGTAAGLLEACAGRYRDVAAAAAGHAADVRRLEGSWPE